MRDVVQGCGGIDGEARVFNCACPGPWTLISMPPGPKLVVGCCERWMVLENGSFLVTLALLLLRIGPPSSSKSFFLSGVDQPGFKRFWHVLFEVGVCAFAPFGPLTAASGLAHSHPAHVQGAANNWRTLGLSAFFPKTSDRYRVLCLIFPVCHKTKIGLPQLPSFVFPSHEQTLVLSLSLILIRHSS